VSHSLGQRFAENYVSLSLDPLVTSEMPQPVIAQCTMKTILNQHRLCTTKLINDR